MIPRAARVVAKRSPARPLASGAHSGSRARCGNPGCRFLPVEAAIAAITLAELVDRGRGHDAEPVDADNVLAVHRGYDLILVARRAERLDQIGAALAEEYGITARSLPADLSDPASPRAICAQLEAWGAEVDVLINNAGLSGSTAFTETPWEKIAAELQIQVNAATELIHRLAPGMKERGWGRIINLSSVAAFQPPAESLLYTGIKTYTLNMSQALNMELSRHGVHVTALCPGFTYSEFHDVMDTRDAADRLPGLLWGNPDQVVRAGWSAVMRGKPVCVPRVVNKFLAASMRPVPLGAQYKISTKVKVL